MYFDDYIGSLPDGLDSYPECRHKASFYLDFIEHVPVARRVKEFPEPLRYLVEKPAAPNAWLPEVHTNAFYMAVRDVVLRSDEELIRAMYDVNVRVLSTPLNRVMFMVATPALLMAAGQGRWAAFHTGSRFLTKRRGHEGTIEMTYPKNLFPRLMLQVYEQVFQAVMDLSREGAEVRLVSPGPHSAKFEVHWGTHRGAKT